MIDADIGQLPLTLDNSPFKCVDKVDLELFLRIPDSLYKKGRKQKVRTSNTVNTFCSTAPIDFCLEARSEGLCIRSDQYWTERIAKIRAARKCGCDPLHCPKCNTGGRPAKSCSYCGHLTGFERSAQLEFNI